MKLILALGAAWLTTVLAHGNDARDAFAKETEAWRSERVVELTAPDGWLTLVGLHLLEPGRHSVGTAKANDIVLTKGPARLGMLAVAKNGTVTLTLAADADARIDGPRVGSAELKPGGGAVKPTMVTFGTMSCFIIDRNGKPALRVKDSASVRRTQFAGLEYFPIDPAWRIEARWEPFEKLRMMPVTDRLGQTGPMLIAGQAMFERDGQSFSLLAIDEGPGRPLFFVFSDATSGRETYGAARFIYAAPRQDGKVVLDFNRAENPPCAFTPFAVCPLPPAQNRLPFAVPAGEKVYHGGPE